MSFNQQSVCVFFKLRNLKNGRSRVKLRSYVHTVLSVSKNENFVFQREMFSVHKLTSHNLQVLQLQTYIYKSQVFRCMSNLAKKRE